LTFLALELTGKCNLSCGHCFASSGPAGTHGTMTDRDWRARLDVGAFAFPAAISVSDTDGERVLPRLYEAVLGPRTKVIIPDGGDCPCQPGSSGRGRAPVLGPGGRQDFGGRRPDGSTALSDADGAPVSFHFFGQSSSGSHANLVETSIVSPRSVTTASPRISGQAAQPQRTPTKPGSLSRPGRRVH
jgi:hypothetical protein